jgi:hypothetical protein
VRLWSFHPKYLDGRGLVTLWRETLLAQQVLLGKTKGYKNHPQLDRFKPLKDPAAAVAYYLKEVWDESCRRQYCFNAGKIGQHRKPAPVAVTRGQLEYEFAWLCTKLKTRDPAQYKKIEGTKKIEPHPLFKIVPGPVADWERVKEEAIPAEKREMLGADCCGDL